MKRTPLKRKRRIKVISERQIAEMLERKRLKEHLFIKQGRKCALCGTATPDFRGWQLSHKTPLSRGGKTEVDNLEVLCARCHSVERHGIKECR